MRKVFRVEAHWDDDAKVWTSRSDLPGLVIEADTLAEFESLMSDLAPELISENIIGDGDTVEVQWHACKSLELRVA